MVGVSKDSVKAHGNFVAKHGLRIPLLSDPTGEFIEAAGAWGEKKMAGKTRMGILRSTYVLDAAGEILKVYPKVKANGHAEQVLADLKGLG